MMFTVVYTPRGVCTLADIYLSTVTLNVVQPDLSSTDTVVVVRLRSNVPDSVAGTL